VNKYDLNNEMAEKIEKYCHDNNVEMLGKISFDKSIAQNVRSHQLPQDQKF